MIAKCTTIITVLLVLIPGTALFGATVDPLLRGLESRQLKTPGAMDINYEKLIAVQYDPDGVLRIGVILQLDGSLPDLSSVPGLKVGSVLGDIATARLPLSSLETLASINGVRHVAAARMNYPALDVAVPAGNVDQVWNGNPVYTGNGVIVGIIDSGIDWRHADFDHADGSTRILTIWDLYGTGTPPTGFTYGAEHTSTDINAGTVAERDYSGHGTHVSGMAAGNGRASDGLYKGVAYEADIVFAKAFDDDQGGFASDKTIDAMNYLATKAQQFDKPMVVNMSLGGHSGPHDGTYPQEEVVDFLTAQGLTFCIAAGNEGEDFLHDSGPAAGTDLIYRIMPFEPNQGDGNDFTLITIWVEGDSSPQVSVSINQSVVGPLASGNVEGYDTPDGVVVIDNASEGLDPLNGDKLILIQMDDRQGTLPSDGDWTIRIEGGTGEAHAWNLISAMVTGFPNSDQGYSVGYPGNAETAITLAAIKTRQQWPSLAGTSSYPGGTWGEAQVGDRAPFSSIGPTRDGREKPDLAAPGMAIISVRSQDITPVPQDQLLASGGDYFVTQGTSMASPFTAGVVALMLEKNPDLSPAEIKNILRSTAATDAFTGAVWNPHWGMGKVDAAAAIAAVEGGSGANGDVNGSGNADVIDLVVLVNHIVDMAGHPLNSDQRIRADVYPSPSGDGVLNASDLARIVAFILGTDQPGKDGTITPVALTINPAYEAPDGWWLPVHVKGFGMAAGQFALNLSGSSWRNAQPYAETDESIFLASGTTDNQMRVMVYDLDNKLPGEMIVHLPVHQPAEAHLAGLLVVDSHGDPLQADLRTEPQVSGFLEIKPNPTRGESVIRFLAPLTGTYTLSVYDLRGRKLNILRQGKGSNIVEILQWNGDDGRGRRLPDGVYFVQLESSGKVMTRKVTLTR